MGNKNSNLAWLFGLWAISSYLVAAPQDSTGGLFRPLTGAWMEGAGNWDYALDGSGQLWLAYYDRDRLLRLRTPQRQERLLVPDNRAQSPSGIALAPTARGVIALWRDKHPDKGLYLLDSERMAPDRPINPIEIGGDTEPLARFVARVDQDDRVHLLWYGEKAGQPTGSIHNLYYRLFDRKTGELSPIELVAAGIYPVMAVDQGGNLVVVSWQGDVQGRRIVARARPAGGQFAEPVVIADDVSEITPVFEAFHVNDRWLVFWVSQYGLDRRGFRLEGAYSDDLGKSWQRLDFPALHGYDIANLNLADDGQGHLVLAITARQRTQPNEQKQDVYVIRSSDRGTSWSEPTRLRSSDPETLALFRARYPVVAFGRRPGQVLVVWEDWRTIRSSLYASLSNDYGATWQPSEVPVPREPGTNLGLRYAPNALYATDQGFHLIAEHYPDDQLKEQRLVALAFDETNLKQWAEAARHQQVKADEGSLRKRVESYWQAMQQGDYKTTYEHLDSFFRSLTPLDVYLSKMGKIKYTQAKIEGVQIKGPIAEVRLQVQASIPPFKAQTTGETIKRDERRIQILERWLWIDGDWFKEFRIESQDIAFTRY